MEYTVLYTHQKTKKAKTWQDGILMINVAQSRAVLYDEKRSKLDAVFVKPNQVRPGEEIESDRFLIQIEELCSGSPDNYSSAVVESGNPDSSGFKSAPRVASKPSLPVNSTSFQKQMPRVGLKRRRAGFVPPRQVKISGPVDDNNSEDRQSNLDTVTKPSDSPGLFGLYSSSGSHQKPDTESPRSLSSFLNPFGANSSPWSVIGQSNKRSTSAHNSPELVAKASNPDTQNTGQWKSTETHEQKTAGISAWKKYLCDSIDDEPSAENIPNQLSSGCCERGTDYGQQPAVQTVKRSTNDILALISSTKSARPEQTEKNGHFLLNSVTSDRGRSPTRVQDVDDTPRTKLTVHADGHSLVTKVTVRNVFDGTTAHTAEDLDHHGNLHNESFGERVPEVLAQAQAGLHTQAISVKTSKTDQICSKNSADRTVHGTSSDNGVLVDSAGIAENTQYGNSAQPSRCSMKGKSPLPNQPQSDNPNFDMELDINFSPLSTCADGSDSEMEYYEAESTLASSNRIQEHSSDNMTNKTIDGFPNISEETGDTGIVRNKMNNSLKFMAKKHSIDSESREEKTKELSDCNKSSESDCVVQNPQPVGDQPPQEDCLIGRPRSQHVIVHLPDGEYMPEDTTRGIVSDQPPQLDGLQFSPELEDDGQISLSQSRIVCHREYSLFGKHGKANIPQVSHSLLQNYTPVMQDKHVNMDTSLIDTDLTMVTGDMDAGDLGTPTDVLECDKMKRNSKLEPELEKTSNLDKVTTTCTKLNTGTEETTRCHGGDTKLMSYVEELSKQESKNRKLKSYLEDLQKENVNNTLKPDLPNPIPNRSESTENSGEDLGDCDLSELLSAGEGPHVVSVLTTVHSFVQDEGVTRSSDNRSTMRSHPIYPAGLSEHSVGSSLEATWNASDVHGDVLIADDEKLPNSCGILASRSFRSASDQHQVKHAPSYLTQSERSGCLVVSSEDGSKMSELSPILQSNMRSQATQNNDDELDWSEKWTMSGAISSSDIQRVVDKNAGSQGPRKLSKRGQHHGDHSRDKPSKIIVRASSTDLVTALQKESHLSNATELMSKDAALFNRSLHNMADGHEDIVASAQARLGNYTLKGAQASSMVSRSLTADSFVTSAPVDQVGYACRADVQKGIHTSRHSPDTDWSGIPVDKDSSGVAKPPATPELSDARLDCNNPFSVFCQENKFLVTADRLIHPSQIPVGYHQVPYRSVSPEPLCGSGQLVPSDNREASDRKPVQSLSHQRDRFLSPVTDSPQVPLRYTSTDRRNHRLAPHHGDGEFAASWQPALSMSSCVPRYHDEDPFINNRQHSDQHYLSESPGADRLVRKSAWNDSTDINDSLLSLDICPYTSELGNTHESRLRKPSDSLNPLSFREVEGDLQGPGSKWDLYVASNVDTDEGVLSSYRQPPSGPGHGTMVPQTTRHTQGIDHLVPVSTKTKTEIQLGSDCSGSDRQSANPWSDDSEDPFGCVVDSLVQVDQMPRQTRSVSEHAIHSDNMLRASRTVEPPLNSHEQFRRERPPSPSRPATVLPPVGNRTQPTTLCTVSDHRPVSKKQSGFKPPRVIGWSAHMSSSVVSKPPGLHRSVGHSSSPASMVNTSQTLSGELRFASGAESEACVTACRQMVIPVSFSNAASYTQTMSAAVREYLNTQLLELSKAYHTALSKVDISQYSSIPAFSGPGCGNKGSQSVSNNPKCDHKVPAKIVQVKKQGVNQGRYFFACNSPRDQQCKFFKWADQNTSGNSSSGGTASKPPGGSSIQLSDGPSISTFFKGQGVSLYCDCQFLRKTIDQYDSYNKNIPPWIRKKMQNESCDRGKKKIFLRVSRKESSSAYTKDDLWIVSENLTFDPRCSFLAKSVFFGPRSNNEIEIEPIGGYSASNWQHEMTCYAIHAGNAASELICLSNMEEFVKPACMPVLSALLNREQLSNESKFICPSLKQTLFYVSTDILMGTAVRYIEKYSLNKDQAEALSRIASMLAEEQDSQDVVLIHGVFGAGKSFLLAVVVVYLVEIFSYSDSHTPGVPLGHKILLSSITNVAVDRILLGLLELGFEEFVRVGSVKKIAKPVLPYSVHASGTDNQEMKDLQDMLKSDLTAAEKVHVRKSVEKLRKGENKKKLSQVCVVGATCAACPFPCLKDFNFTVVILDECSQMTEPVSLLPAARFNTHKLVLVGDPKQLDPTIQGSDAAHKQGLEQTMFDRLSQMGYQKSLLRTQYRCHPRISSMASKLFYSGELQDGIQASDRPPLVPDLPTLCFVDVQAGQELTEGGGSFYNEAEAQVVRKVTEALLEQGVDPSDIGVITLYKAQQRKINHCITESSSRERSELKSIQVSTVDAFQGAERGIIILSCVRTRSVGFIDCSKRTNVALTRAKNHLLIVGHKKNLGRNQLWSRVIQHCQGSSEAGLQASDEFVQKHCQVPVCQTTDSPESPHHQCTQDSAKPNHIKPTKSHKRKSHKLSDDEDFLDDTIFSRECDFPPNVSGLDISTPSPPMCVSSNHSPVSEATGECTNEGSNGLDCDVGTLFDSHYKRPKRRKLTLQSDIFDDEFGLSAGLDFDDDDGDLPSVL